MSHLLLFRPEIKQVLNGSLHLDGLTRIDLLAEASQLVHLVRVVGQQTQALDAKLPQELRAEEILPLVSVEAQSQIGLQRVHALLLQIAGNVSEIDVGENVDPPAHHHVGVDQRMETLRRGIVDDTAFDGVTQ